MLKIEFETVNDDFQGGNARQMTASLLHTIAGQISVEGKDSGNVRDSNGNTIGHWSLSIDADQEGGE